MPTLITFEALMESNVEILIFIIDIAKHDVVVAKFLQPLPDPPLAQRPLEG